MKIKANIVLKVTADGGRENPVYSGYRPTFKAGLNQQSDCVVTVIDNTNIKPGSTGIVELKILHPEKVSGIKEGDNYILAEGAKEIAKGTIISIRLYPFNIND